MSEIVYLSVVIDKNGREAFSIFTDKMFIVLSQMYDVLIEIEFKLSFISSRN